MSQDPDGSLYDAVIPNYYDPSDFPEPPAERGQFLLYIGRLISRKGLAIALNTARAVGRELLLAGPGLVTEPDGSRHTQDGVEIPDWAHCVGTVGMAERADLMGQARAVIMPTMFMEPFGGVAAEAQLMGAPVISTDHAAFSETVKHGFSGYRCHTLDQFAWAVDNTHKLASARDIRARAMGKWSLAAAAPMYAEYFDMLSGLWGAGWPTLNPGRSNLDWLNSTAL